MNPFRLSIVIGLLFSIAHFAFSQSNNISYDDFFNKSHTTYLQHGNLAIQSYNGFREKANKRYVEYLKSAWGNYYTFAPITRPKDDLVTPRPYNTPIEGNPIETIPNEEPIVLVETQPQPIEPIEDHPIANLDNVTLDFYGIHEQIRLPKFAKMSNSIFTIDQIAEAWGVLSQNEIDNTLYDCLQIRQRYNLCDWAYLQILEKLSTGVCGKGNGATLLMAFIYCQSGYQMRLALDESQLFMLYGSKHLIFDQGYFNIDGTIFYPFGVPANSIQICNAEFQGETPLSLFISSEQKLGGNLSEQRIISSKYYSEAIAASSVYTNLIDFYNSYPTSSLNNNPMTRWAMYANTPLSDKTKGILYLGLSKAIQNKTKLQAADLLLNWVQTGFVYEYDDKVWGHDRALFAEESLYYPYCDCEDRSILFSRLIRDLLGLDVALIYYPGHLATAVCFNEDVKGDAMIIDGRKFIVCDPTYIGAPVGAQMPNLEYDKAQAILLTK